MPKIKATTKVNPPARFTDQQVHYRTLLIQLIEAANGNPFSDGSCVQDVAWFVREHCFPDDDGGDDCNPAVDVEEELLS